MTPDRRTLIVAGATLAAAAATPALAQPSGLGAGAGASKLFRTTETANGKVMGIANGPIWEFRGIPYGAPTGGKNRYLPPKSPASWGGVRECFAFGQVNPQVQSDLRGEYGQLIMWDRQVGGMGEDCLVLNVWTPSTERAAKKPVFVSFHGGGFSSGSGNAPGFDGKNLAHYADAVVVTINHRLAAFGYLNLAGAGAGDAFKYAGVCGALDMVAALKWVKANIEGFGGDPDRVMIFGQSGGGAKTSTVLAMPGGKGLFHSAGVQSGSALRLMTPEAGTAAAERLLKQLGLTGKNAADIQKKTWQEILEAQTAVGGGGFSPVIGTDALPNHPFDPKAPDVSRDVPIVVSTTLEDAALGLTNFDMTEDQLKGFFEQRWPGKGKDLHALYRQYDPLATPFLIQAQALTDSGFRRSAFIMATRKAEAGGAPAYMAQWNWRTPAYDGKFGAVHGIDVSASFHSYRDGFFAGSTPGKRMADRFASAWGAMAATGNPNNPHLPPWPAYDDAKRAVMIFDNDTRVDLNPRAGIRAYWDANPPPPGPRG